MKIFDHCCAHTLMKSTLYFITHKRHLVFCSLTPTDHRRQLENKLNLSGAVVICANCPWLTWCGTKQARQLRRDRASDQTPAL